MNWAALSNMLFAYIPSSQIIESLKRLSQKYILMINVKVALEQMS